MSQTLSFFSDYSSGENRVTNYCGLMLKMLYQERPDYFETVIENIVSEVKQIQIGPSFLQQAKTKVSVPDLAIRQQSFTIYFENKLSDWFYSEQVVRHIDSIRAEKSETKIIFLLGNIDPDNVDNRLEETIAFALDSDGPSQQVIIKAISYEDFIDAFKDLKLSESLEGLFEEFKDYLNRNNLLPQWKYLLDVVNCVSTMHEIDNGVYICPDSGGAYKHQRARFFGPYKDKTVSQIHEIRAVIAIAPELEPMKPKWINTNEEPEALMQEAVSKLALFPNRVSDNKTAALQVFLLGDAHATDFKKDSKGGMIGSKQYFWNIATDEDDAKTGA